MIIVNGILFCEDGIFRKMDIETRNGIITSIGKGLEDATQTVFNAGGCYVVPGLVDIHVHGAAGADFCDDDPYSIERVARFLLNHGVTSFLATSMSLPEERLANIYKTIRPFVGQSVPGQAVLQGINMEGPFISVEKRGAQNEKYITSPDFDMFLRLHEASGDNIRTVAVAPEVKGGLDFIGKAHSLCNVSLAHSCADYSTASAAFTVGANHVTHIFNGMTPLGHRAPGIIGAAADSGVYVELICDGLHVHQSVVRAIFKLFGDDKVCLISDAMRACGMPDGRYDLGDQLTTIAGGSATLEDGTLAGSVTALIDCLRRAVAFGVPLESALKAATINPAKSMGLNDRIGCLSRGRRADMLVLGKDLMLENIFFGGTLHVRW